MAEVAEFSGTENIMREEVNVGELSLVANFLDAETQLLYAFEVTAEDNGMPPRSATSQVQITITDTNDNSPTFTSSLIIFSVPENSATSATIQVVSATDADIDTTNNQLTYSISSQNPIRISSLFSRNLAL